MPILIISLISIALLWMFFCLIPVRLWIAAIAAGVKISIFSLIGMRLRKVSPHVIVPCIIMLHKAGLSVNTDRLEAHYLAGGDVIRVVKALISAKEANLDLDFERACAVDLAKHKS